MYRRLSFHSRVSHAAVDERDGAPPATPGNIAFTRCAAMISLAAMEPRGAEVGTMLATATSPIYDIFRAAGLLPAGGADII